MGNIGYVYLLKWKDVYKIGSAKDYKERFQRNLRKKPNSKLLKVYMCEDYYNIEIEMHKYFKECRVSYNSEWFCLTKEELKTFNLIMKDLGHRVNFKKVV